jgi:hypothetical protein
LGEYGTQSCEIFLLEMLEARVVPSDHGSPAIQALQNLWIYAFKVEDQTMIAAELLQAIFCSQGVARKIAPQLRVPS